MNEDELFRLRFQSLVAAGLASTRIAARVGLAAASEVWGGDEPRERPAWYLWLRDRPGAWQLELAATEPLAGADGAVGRFTIRHYPAPGSTAFALFSADEQRLATAALDGTGTPRIELAASIPGDFFVVGTMDWALDRGADASAFALASLDRLRVRAETGPLLRDVPGWSLAMPAFSAVVGLHAQVERRAATRLVASRLAGFEASPAGEPSESAALAFGEAFVAFPGPGRDRQPASALVGILLDPEAEVLHDLEPHPWSAPLDADPRIPLVVSRGWFGGEQHAHDRALCAC